MSGAFFEVSHVFKNIECNRVHQHCCVNEPVLRILEGARALFRSLDRKEQRSSDLRIQAWVVRATVLNTILPFDDPTLALEENLTRLNQHCSGFPEAAEPVAAVCQAVRELIRLKRNPKLDLLRELAFEGSNSDPKKRIGIICKLANGSAPGWPRSFLQSDSFAALEIVALGTRTDLKQQLFDRLVLPCGGSNIPKALLTDIYYGGFAPCADVLLYQGERLEIPDCLTLPSGELPFKVKHFELVFESTRHAPSDPIEEDTRWADDTFWQKLHGAQRNHGHASVEAHFVLFADGTGCFVPSGERAVTVLKEAPSGGGPRDLFRAGVNDLDESTLLVLKEGGSDFMLDEAFDLGVGNDKDSAQIDEVTWWKSALEALLVTHSEQEVSDLLALHGAHVSPLTVKNWVGAEVLGPRAEADFRALMNLLIEKRKLAPIGIDQEWISYAWQKLKQFRSKRQQAGKAIWQSLSDKLLAQYRDSNTAIGDRTVVQLSEDGSVELLILRVEAVDLLPSYVTASSLFRVDDFRGRKWRG